MNKNLLKKTWFNVLILFGINIAISGIVALIFWLIKIPMQPIMPAIAGIVAAQIVGSIYYRYLKEIMPDKLKLRIVLTYAVIQVIIIMSFLALEKLLEIGIIVLSILVIGIYTVAQYYSLNAMVRAQLKGLAQKKAKAKKK